MNNLFRLAFRNALRNGKRSLLTAATVMIGTAFTVVTLSFIGGVYGGMTDDWSEMFGPVRVVTTEYAERELLQPLHLNMPETDGLLKTIRAIDGVGQAEVIIRTGVIASVGEEIGEDSALLIGASKGYYDKRVIPHATLPQGVWLDETAKDEQVVLGARVARDIGAKLGDEILLMGTTQYGSMAPISADVVGIVTGNTSIDTQAYVSLETARWMIDVPEGALEIVVYPSEEGRPAVVAVADAVRAELGDAYDVSPWMSRGMWEANLPIMDGMELGFALVVVFVMALAIFNTMTMSVLERTGEIGVLRAMGQSRLGAVVSFLVEATIIGIAGGVGGVIVGAIPALYLQNNGMTFSQDLLEDMGNDMPMTTTLTAQFTPEVVGIALMCGVLTALIGAALPALRAANIQPYEAMRAKR